MPDDANARQRHATPGTGSPEKAPLAGTADRFTLAELTTLAGVSVRTIRYYIAEGLLPPPVGAGPKSYYTHAHLDRLRLIARLRAAYLPLKEIRRRLSGRSDAEIAALVAADRAAATPPAPEPAPPALESAAAYLDRLLGGPTTTTRPAPRLEAAQPLVARMEEPPLGAAPAPMPASGEHPEADAGGTGWRAASVRESAPPEGETWRRLRIGDDVELLVRAAAYERLRERIEWLVAWARKVLR